MNATRRAIATRFGSSLLAVLLLASQFPFSAASGLDPDEAEESGGRPLARPDAPGAAVAFRQLQWKNEHGSYRVNGFVEARNHADAMRARARSRRFPAAAPSPASGTTMEGAATGPGPLAPAAAGSGPSAWTWLGPGNIGGRVRSLLIDPTDPQVMFAGGVAGGVFKSTTGGASWAPLDDFMANLAISTLVMRPGLPTTLYAGTGEGFYNTDGIRGAGVFTSTDGGLTWSQLPATADANWWYVNRLAISPNAGVMLAATRTGIYRSTNGGVTWTNARPTEMTYVAFHPTDSSRAIASGYAGNAYVSTNGGAAWTAATGLPGGDFTRVELAYARGNPSVVYASIDMNGGSLYKSTDGGASFSAVFNGSPDYLGMQGWYGNTLWVDPTNEHTLIVGGIDLWKSTNGGTSLTRISNWAASPASPHADHHAIVEQPGFNGTSNSRVWFTNDGGIYGTDNVYTAGGGSAPYTFGWSVFNNNLGVTQFYGGGGSAATGVILGGTQDNGTLKYTPATGTSWSTEFGGDGGAAAVDPFNSDNLYGEYAYGAVHRSTDGGADADWINGLIWNGVNYACKPAPYAIADSCGASRANFVAPLVLDPNDSNRLFLGGASLWRTNDATAPNTATTGPTWTNVKSAVGSGNYISAVAVAAGDPDAIWVAHNGGQLYKTTNGTATAPAWAVAGVGVLPSRFVTRVRVDPSDANTVYVTYGGFSAANVWRTTDGGTSWVSVSGSGVTGLPHAPVRDIAISALEPMSLYAATEMGLFTSVDGGSTWTAPEDGPTNVSIEELFWMGPSLVAVTHGRGVFKTTTLTSDRLTPVIDWPTPGAIEYGTALDEKQLNATAGVPGTFIYSPPAGTVLRAGAQPLSVRFTPTDAVNYTTVTASQAITVAKATPTVTWSPPASIVHGTALTAAQLNATANGPGTFVYSPPVGTVLPAGAGQPLTVTFTPSDAANYTAPTATGTVFITVTVAVPTIDALVWTDRPTAQSTVASPAFSTTASNELLLAFVSTDYGSGANVTVTGVTGAALSWVLVGRTNVQSGTSEIWRAFAPAPLTSVTVTASLSQPVSSMITVVSFANVDTSGANGSGAIGATASANSLAGAPTATLVTTRNNGWVFGVGNDYDNPIGRTVGSGQTLVHQYLPPVGDTYWVQRRLAPTPLSGTSVTINATAPAGDRYNLFIAEIRPFAGVDTTAPAVSLTAPSNSATVSGTSVAVSAAASDTVGVTGVQFKLDGINLGAEDVSIPYTIAWDTTTAASGSHSLTAVARDGAGNTATSAAVNVTISNPVTITWNAPASIVYGTALSATQLNATASVPGTFVYVPAAGTVLTAGAAQPLSVTFTPADTLNYSTATASVSITVGQTTPIIIWGAPANITYGTALSATQLNAATSVPGTFVYRPAVGTLLPAGPAQSLTVTFTPTSPNYGTAAASRTITVAKARPVIAWSTPASIAAGTALSAAQLNATANVPGTFVYTPPAGTVLGAGSNQVLLVAFAPLDAANYTTATASVLINVTAVTDAAPIIDALVWTDRPAAQSTVASPPFSTTASNELVLAFISTDYVSGTNTSVTGVVGAGLTWVLVGRANVQRGTSEIWRAFAAAPLNSVTVTATLSQPVSSMITVISFANVDTSGTNGSGAIGATASANSLAGAPTATLVTTSNNGWVFGVGNDYDKPIGRTVGSGQILVHQYLPPVGDTYWVQRRLAPTPLAGSSVTINATAPSGDRYNLFIAEIRPFAGVDTTAPSVSLTAPSDSATVSGTSVAISAAASDNVSVAGVQFTLDGVNLGVEDVASPYTIAWDTTTAPNGTHSLTAVARDGAGNTTTSAAVSITVSNSTADLTPPTVTITAPAPGSTVMGPAVTVSAAASDAGGVAGVQFLLDGVPLGAEVTAAPFTRSWSTTMASNGVHTLAARARDAADNVTTSAPVSVTVSNPVVITWSTPAGIVYGTALGPTQLNATASVAGTFVYTPAAGTVLSAGSGQSLSLVFTPTDAVNYTTATASVAITVLKAMPIVSWAAPASIVYGTALGAAQLNATATAAGIFVYTPAAGTILPLGAGQALTLIFTPTDTANYTTATAGVTITVLPATPVIDAVVWTDEPAARPTISSPAFSTKASNELVLAFIATDYNNGVNTSVTGVTGAGLTWVLVARTNVQSGTSEIWRAFAPAPLTGATVTASLSQPVSSMLTIVSFSNVDTSGTNGSGAVGATATANRSFGAPTATLVTTRNNSWVFGVGNDFDKPIARTVGAGQTLVHQYLPPVGDTYWVQRTSNPAPLAGTSVTINDTAPITDRYNLTLCEIRAPQ